MEVFEARQIQPAFVRGHIGDVADPSLVGSLDSKTLPEHIRGHQ